MFQSNTFHGVIPRASDGGRLGWLEDSSYWKAYWGSFDELCKRGDFSENDGLRMSMVSNCVHEAAAVSNMAFFKHVTGAHAKQTVSDCLQIGHHILPPSVMAWLATVEDRPGFAAQDIVDQQEQLWRNLSWVQTKGEKSPLFSQLGQPEDVEHIEKMLEAAFGAYCLDRREQVYAIAHILTRSPAEWMSPQAPGGPLLARLKTRVGSKLMPGVDLDTIALCCGHGPNDREVFKDIKIMGRLLIVGHTKVNRKRQQNPDLAMLSSLYDLSSIWELYDAVQTSGLLAGKPVKAFALPDMDMALA